MRRPTGLIALTVLGTAGLTGLAVAQPAPVLRDAAVAELDFCLQGQRWSLDDRHLASTADEAPGLPQGMRLARIPTSSGKLVVYEDDGRGSVIECGVALYGAAPVDMEAGVQRSIERAKPGFRVASPRFWSFKDVATLDARYWGDPRGPSLYGVLMRRSASGGSAPVVQVDSHSILVH